MENSDRIFRITEHLNMSEKKAPFAPMLIAGAMVIPVSY